MNHPTSSVRHQMLLGPMSVNPMTGKIAIQALAVLVLASSFFSPMTSAWAAEKTRTERLSLADAVLQALERNLDISVSRRNRDIRLTDILFEQAKFDPTFALGGSFNRSITPLNRPVFGLTSFTAPTSQIRSFDQNITAFNVGLTQNLLTGANYNLTMGPQRTFVAGPNFFLFNAGYTNALTFTLTQPLLQNFGLDVNRTLIRIARNNAKVEGLTFLSQVLTVISTVEQNYWELVFTRENLNVAKAALRAAEELLASNRAKAKAGVMAAVDVLQAQAGVATRVEQVVVAEKAVHDQEDQVRRLLNPAEQDLRQNVTIVPIDQLTQTLVPITLEETLDVALEKRFEVLQAAKNIETGTLNVKFAKNQLLPNLAFQGTIGLNGLGKNPQRVLEDTFGGNFYNYTAGLTLSFPLGMRSAWSQYNRRQLEVENAKVALQSARQQVIITVREAVRRVKTDFKRIETARSARILAEKQLQAEQERLNVGLSFTRVVLEFMRDLAISRINELRAIVDFNKSLSNLALNTSTTLERYNIELR